MPRKLTQEVVSKFKEVHGDRYDYSEVEYVNTHTKLRIICKVHGLFEQSSSNHLAGKGCGQCSGNCKVGNKDKFIEKDLVLHKGIYSYNKVKYKNAKSKVVITCRTHGDFEMTPDEHTSGKNGCSKCAIFHS